MDRRTDPYTHGQTAFLYLLHSPCGGGYKYISSKCKMVCCYFMQGVKISLKWDIKMATRLSFQMASHSLGLLGEFSPQRRTFSCGARGPAGGWIAAHGKIWQSKRAIILCGTRCRALHTLTNHLGHANPPRKDTKRGNRCIKGNTMIELQWG